MSSAQASEQTVDEAEPGLPAPDPAGGKGIEPVMRVPPVPEGKARKEAVPDKHDEHRPPGGNGLRRDGSLSASSGLRRWPLRSSPSSWRW